MDSRQVSFTGFDKLGNFATNYIFTPIQTNKIVEYTAVDAVSMVIPRVYIDYNRNEDTGKETARREVLAAFTECIAPGFLAAGLGFMMGKAYDKRFNIATQLYADSTTLEMLKNAWVKTNDAHNEFKGGNYWKKTGDAPKKEVLKDYIEHVLKRTGGLDGENWKHLTKVSEEAVVKAKAKGKESDSLSKIAQDLADIVYEKDKPKGKKLKEIEKRLVNLLGASENLRVIIEDIDSDKIHADAFKDKEKTLETTAKRLIADTVGVGQGILTKVENLNFIKEAIKKSKTISYSKATLTLALISGFGFSQQFINRHITKKKTGSAAFVALSPEALKQEKEKESQDKNAKLKLNVSKALSLSALFAIAAASIAGSVNPKIIKEQIFSKKLLNKLEFKDYWPSTNQLRVFYTSIIAGRMLASADKHELRETDTRDIPGFLNWLVIGGFVSKLVGNHISGGKLMNGAKPKENLPWWKKAFHVIEKNVLVTHAEINARCEKDLINPAEKIKQIRKLNMSIAAGLIYSTLALGVFVPKLNKYITNKLTAKKNDDKNASAAENKNLSPVINKKNEAFADFIKIEQKLHKAA